MKKAENKKKTVLKGSSKVLITVGAIALVLSCVVYGLLITMENAVLGKYDKQVVYIAKEDIAKGTQITDTSYFVKKSVDTDVVPTNAITDYNVLKDTFALTDINKNEILVNNKFGAIENEEVGTKKISIPCANTVTGSVNGTIRTSDYIDIYIVPTDYNISGSVKKGYDISGETEEKKPTSYNLLKPTYTRVYVSEVFDDKNVKIANNDTSSVTASFNIVLPESEADYVMSAICSGYKIYTVLNVE